MLSDADREILKEQIIKHIKSGDVKMRPRWYFMLRDILGVIAIVIILLIAIYLASFIIFVLHQSGAWFVPVFGIAGWYSLFNALPWVLISLSGIFVIVLASLARRYQFGYQWPLIYSLMGITFLIVAACFVFVDSSLYDNLFNSPTLRNLPLLGQYYPGIGYLAPNDVRRGTVILTGINGFVLRDNAGSISNVLVGSNTAVPHDDILRAGDSVLVFGERNATGTIFAVGVEKLAD